VAEQSLRRPLRRSSARVLIVIWALLAVPIAESAELRGLATAARSILGVNQGVYVEAADGTVLLAQAASTAVHPASVSKVPTTLALLRKLGPEHRFTTTFTAKGRILEGTLYGDLMVESDGDPSLVDEDALLVAERLRQSGIDRIAGDLLLRAPLTFDWKIDADGASLRHALSGLTPAAAWQAVRALEVSNPNRAADLVSAPGIRFGTATAWPADRSGAAPVIELPGDRPLIVHRSQPLLPLVKSLNDYSNNIFTPFADAAGGAAAVESLARTLVPEEMRSEIILGDGAGTDPTNRLSPRAAVKLLRALEQELATTGHALFDILPVAGVDDGTLRDRLNGPGEAGHVLGKTGTFGDYGASALVGAIATTDRGTVYFAILDHDVPVSQARRRQDRFVRALLAHLHSVPWNYQRDPRAAITRAEVSVMPW
jgi:D-alanyl-D-alanine carboxypeptidase/D-alanyl-D-alanine-endopeptidase (penicillin-binding protein 4)